MDGSDENFVVVGEWSGHNPNYKKICKDELDRDFSLEDIKNKDFQDNPSYSLGGLSERIAARAGFNLPRLKTEDIHWSPCLTISSQDVSHATLLESPVFVSNPLAQLSPTTGQLSWLPWDEPKQEIFDDSAKFLASQYISRKSLDSTNIGSEPNDSQDYEQTQVRGLGDWVASGGPSDDGYHWRKYGQKQVKGSEYPRSYYKCTHPNCEVKKKVERSREGHITKIIYAKDHNHPKPLPNRRSSIGSSGKCLDMERDETKQEGFVGTNRDIEWRSPVSTELAYRSHFGSMQAQSGTQFGYGDVAAVAFFKEEDASSHMSVYSGYGGVDESESKRRKLAEISGSTRATHEPKVVVKMPSDIDILEDGYRWRKYGQKVVKGNPNPRSYYKCTANGCTVTKHVERASDDLASVVTSYIGKHTHEVPAARNTSHVSPSGSRTLQGGLATRNHSHHVSYPEPHSRSEEVIADNSSIYDLQPYLMSPSGFSAYIGGQAELLGLSMPGLSIGQEMPAPAISDQAGLMLRLATEPKVEPVLPHELEFSRWIFDIQRYNV